MTGIQTATGAMTDRRPRPRRTSTGDVISRANLRRGVAAAGNAFRSTVPASGSTGRVRERGRRSSASRDARQTDAEEPRVVCRLVLRFMYSLQRLLLLSCSCPFECCLYKL